MAALHNNPLLLEVKSKFEQWRLDKRPGSSIPEDLWKAARALIGNSQSGETCKALRISHEQYRNNILQQPKLRVKNKKAGLRPPPSASLSFIDIPIGSTRFSSATKTSGLTIERPNGTRITFQGISEAQYLPLLKSLLY